EFASGISPRIARPAIARRSSRATSDFYSLPAASWRFRIVVLRARAQRPAPSRAPRCRASACRYETASRRAAPHPAKHGAHGTTDVSGSPRPSSKSPLLVTSHCLDDPLNRFYCLSEIRHLRAELLLAGGGEPVVSSAASRRGLTPLRRQPSLHLHALKRWIQ